MATRQGPTAEAKAECSRYFIALSFNSKGHLGFFVALPIRRASFLVAMGIVEGVQSFFTSFKY